jgi:AraC-like DNA-binding protein
MDFSSNQSASSAAAMPQVLAVGSERTEKTGQEAGSVSHSNVLSVYMEGGPRYALDGNTYEYSAPMAILIPAGTLDHDLQQGHVDGIYVLFEGQDLVRKDPELPGQALVCTGQFVGSVPYFKEISQSDAEKLTQTLRAIESIGQADQIGQIHRTGLLLQALALYLDARPRQARGSVHREAHRLREFVQAWAFENVSLARVYQEIDLSPAHAETLFVKAFGTTAVAYRTQLRLSRARELLMSSKLNVSQVAFEVGYTDPLYFSRVFKRHTGVTPSSLIVDFSNTRK